MSLASRVFRGLDRAAESAPRRPLALETARCVILSDQHKGKRDGADDFRQAERAYNAALGYYLEAGFTLYALGDVEELWECRPLDVLRAYPQSVDLEAQFHAAGRLVRFYGNHDDHWNSEWHVARELRPVFPGLEVLEGLLLEVSDGGEPLGRLLLVHGHQGTTFNDRYRGLGRFAVRHVWRPLQRLARVRVPTPSTSYELREQLDRALHAWAERQDGTVLVTGHTHRPVFIPRRGSEAVARRLEESREKDGPERAALRAELEWLRTLERRRTGIDRPCYFNSGCCCFGDGNVTGLEIADGEIRLVRWPDELGRPARTILRRAGLRAVLEACHAR